MDCILNMEEVQPYKNIYGMTKEEFQTYTNKPYITKEGFIIINHFDKGGKSVTEVTTDYFRRMINKLD